MYIKMAIKEAAKARHHHQLAAVLVRGGKIISIAHNHSHVHAEHAALNRAWRSGTEGATMFVIRVKRSGMIGLAKPCKMCVDRMMQAGVRKVVYTDNEGNFQTMKLPKSSDPTSMSIKYRTILWNKVA